MGSSAGVDEPDDPEAVRADDPDAVRDHVGDVEHAPVRREFHILRHPEPAACSEHPHHALRSDVELEQLPRELAADERLRAVGREIHVVHAPTGGRNGLDERERVRVAEVQSRVALRDDDRVTAVRREVHVVRIVDLNRPRRPSRLRINLGQRVAGVVGDVQMLEVVGGDDVLRQPAHGEVLDDPEGVRVDHVDRVRL